MREVGLYSADDGTIDIAIVNGDLKLDEGLESAVLISLFSDGRISDDEVDAADPKKQGWWGDMFAEVDKDKMGSKLWVLSRAKRTTETLRRAEDYVKSSLQWLIDDGIAASITAAASFVGEVKDARWKIAIDITKPNGVLSRYIVLWDKQKLIRG